MAGLRGRQPALMAIAVMLTGLAAACERGVVSPAMEANGAAMAAGVIYSGWSLAINVEAIPGTSSEFNTDALDGCPFVSRDGKTFFMASTRPGGVGGIDIWVSTRKSENDAWGDPINLGAPINSEQNDFCPTISRDGHQFFFVSNRPGGCGGTDIYTTRFRGDGSLEDPENLGCDVNSAGDEASPFPQPEAGAGPVLYFSSNRAGGFAADAEGAITGDSDIYVSKSHGGAYGPAQLVSGVNSAAEDAQPNVRRDGLELFFFSTRPSVDAFGMADLYAATRARASADWSTPINLGANVNSSAAETRPSLSWDGTTLYFGSTRAGGEGMSDIYVTSRNRN